ncbi:hypothetical protein Tco_1007587 [Tanacetum coccineum]
MSLSLAENVIVAGADNRPPMLDKTQYSSWASRMLLYIKGKENGKLLIDSVLNGPFKYGTVTVPETPTTPATFRDRTYVKREKKAKLFNEWEKFKSTEGESIESYYHRFSKLMNDFSREKHFSEKIASNLKFLNNLQPEWNRSVTVVHQTKNLYEVDYTQLYHFLKFNQAEVNEIRAERLAKTHDPLALMAHSQNPYKYPMFHQDHPLQITYMQHQPTNNNYNPQPSFNQNYMQQPMPNPEDISDPTATMNMALTYTDDWRSWWESVQNPGVQNVENQNGLIVVPRIAPLIANQNANQNGNGNVVAARAEGNANGNNGNQIRCYNYRGLGIQLQAEEFNLMAAAGDINEIEDVNANCVLMANLQQASTSGIQIGTTLIYDLDGTSEVPNSYNCYDNEIFNMFTQEEQYTKLLGPILEPHQIHQNNSNVIPDASSVEHSRGTVDQNPATTEEIRTHFESLYKNLATKVERVNMVNRKMRETNADFTTELTRYKSQ